MATKKRIVFVDDEASVLDGLRRALRAKRSEWDMAFALGADAALAELRSTPSQVIISDMRMPGMDGAALLAVVQREFPNVVRIILSGHAEAEATLRAAEVAHQFLNKPCDLELLSEVIARACDVDRQLKDPLLQRLIGEIQQLPSLRETYTRLTEVLRDPSATVDDIASTVERDMAICAKVLQVTNSAFFGLPHHMSSIREATLNLGVERLQSLVLSVQLFDTLSQNSSPAFPLATAQQHALCSAQIAGKLLTEKRETEDAFAAGLLHDIGLLVIATQLPERCAALLAQARTDQVPLAAVELEPGIGHPEVGAYLLELWGLPRTVVDAVAHQHVPARAGHARFGVVGAVHVGAALAHEQGAPAIVLEALEPLDIGYLDSMGVAGELPRWRELARGVKAPDLDKE